MKSNQLENTVYQFTELAIIKIKTKYKMLRAICLNNNLYSVILNRITQRLLSSTYNLSS